ncbi:hypothetical protein D3C76_1260890 [compost metagenome]|jgi:hypothetical protein|uniref:Uncharacterized protein n=4 Tax=Pseudomonas TaxID=286 RepID=A0AAE7DHC8_9PSED|nr:MULTISPECIES: hypothetical protein [Pseudomonas]KWV89046.1 hypothetical protein PFLmoz3_01945 [Pseudomonas fluorescens]MBI6557401.1 hypothetical protein [Pseudomonas veronii]MBI6654045.1 hypothetical protein [Pseudomonas veronii]MBM6443429.1 hypothetical protein [Pseudomonas sp. MIL9]MRU53294.1 hypothetical protein [Pseudomonas gessardii]
MMSGGITSDGVKICEAAFERLKAGCPVISAHVGIDGSKITAGIVSVEAGFDRGYLKRSRGSHMPLIARIEAYRTECSTTSNSKALQIKRAQNKAGRAVVELEQAREQLYQVLTQNLQLVERVKELENKLKRYQSSLDF